MKWTSVEERLPDPRVDVLAHYEDGFIATDFYGFCGWTRYLNHGNVTHWMPLPKPPTEQ